MVNYSHDEDEQLRITVAAGIAALIAAYFSIGKPPENLENAVLKIIGFLLAVYLGVYAIGLTPADTAIGSFISKHRSGFTHMSHKFYSSVVLFALFYVFGFAINKFTNFPIEPFVVLAALIFLFSFFPIKTEKDIIIDRELPVWIKRKS